MGELSPKAPELAVQCRAPSRAVRPLVLAVTAFASGAGLAHLVVRTLSFATKHLEIAVSALSLATKHLDVAVSALSFATKGLAAAIRRFDVAANKVASNSMASAFAARDLTFAAKGLAVDARQIAPAESRLTFAHRSLTATADWVAVNANDLTPNDSHVRAVVIGSSVRVGGFVARTGRVGPFVSDVTRRANGFDSFVAVRDRGVIARSAQMSSRGPSAGHLTERMQDHGSTVNASHSRSPSFSLSVHRFSGFL